MTDTNVAPAAPAPAVSAPANDQSTAQPANDAGTGSPAVPPSGEAQPPAAPKHSRLQTRIDQITRERYEEQRQREAAESKLAAYERHQQLAQQFSQIDQQTPKIDSFDSLHSYQMAMSDWTARRAAMVATAQWESRMQEMQARQAQQNEQATKERDRVMRENVTLEQKMAAGVKKYPDFQTVIMNPELPTVRGTPLFDAILAAENAVDISYALAKNPAELDRLLAISDPMHLAREVFRLDGKFTGAPATSAPPPPPQRTGSAATSKNWGEMSTGEHVKAYLGAKAKRR